MRSLVGSSRIRNHLVKLVSPSAHNATTLFTAQACWPFVHHSQFDPLCHRYQPVILCAVVPLCTDPLCPNNTYQTACRFAGIKWWQPHDCAPTAYPAPIQLYSFMTAGAASAKAARMCMTLSILCVCMHVSCCDAGVEWWQAAGGAPPGCARAPATQLCAAGTALCRSPAQHHNQDWHAAAPGKAAAAVPEAYGGTVTVSDPSACTV